MIGLHSKIAIFTIVVGMVCTSAHPGGVSRGYGRPTGSGFNSFGESYSAIPPPAPPRSPSAPSYSAVPPRCPPTDTLLATPLFGVSSFGNGFGSNNLGGGFGGGSLSGSYGSRPSGGSFVVSSISRPVSVSRPVGGSFGRPVGGSFGRPVSVSRPVGGSFGRPVSVSRPVGGTFSSSRPYGSYGSSWK